MSAEFDPKTRFLPGTSINKNSAAATITGAYVDMDLCNGPIAAMCGVGAVSGAPDSYSATFSLLEADKSDGTGSQAIPVQDAALVLTADNSVDWLRGRRTKRYVAVQCVLAFVNGTSPKQDVAGLVVGPRYHG